MKRRAIPIELEKAHKAYVKEEGYQDVIDNYKNEDCVKRQAEYLALLNLSPFLDGQFKGQPSFVRNVSFFEASDGKPISVYHSEYQKLVNKLKDNFKDNFISGRSFCLGGSKVELPDFTKVLSNHPHFIAYPYQVLMGHDNGKTWDFDPYEVEVVDNFMGLIMARQVYSSFTVPKESNVGAPTMETGPDVKKAILWRSVTSIERLNELLNEVDETGLSEERRKQIFNEVYHIYNVSSIAIQGLRISNDKHGEVGKTRTFKQYGNTMHTVVDYTDMPGMYARRARIVNGHNYGTNGLTNLILTGIRGYYYDRYFKTYKVKSNEQLDDEFSKCCFVFGLDVTQLDNNTASNRVDYIHDWLLNAVDDEYKHLYRKLFKLSSHPCVYYKPSSYDIGFYANGNPWALADEEIEQNASIGIPSGISSTSELGKFEVTSFMLVNIKRVHDQYERFLNDEVVNKSFVDWVKKNTTGADTDSLINIDDMTELFEDPVSFYDSYEDFVDEFLSTHLNGEFVIKNTGDDTVLGCNSRFLYFFFCFMCLLRLTNSEPSSELFKSLPKVKGYKYCEWHVIDAEEPLSYLGLLLYKYNNKWHFHNNPSSFITNTLLPEKDYKAGNKVDTWGLGYLSRCEVYKKGNPFIQPVINEFEYLFSECFNTNKPSDIALNHWHAYADLIASRSNLTDAIFINNPDSIYYKIDVNDISPELFAAYFEYLDVRSLGPFYALVCNKSTSSFKVGEETISYLNYAQQYKELSYADPIRGSWFGKNQRDPEDLE